MGNLLNDVHYCLRGFARRPLFAVVVVATLALGLSVNAAIFSFYEQILLRELAVPAPEELVNFVAPGPKQGRASCSDIGTCDEIFSYPMFRDLERFDGPFSAIAAHREVDANLSMDGRTVAGQGLLVSGSYFPVLQLQPAVGRLLDRTDDAVDGEASAVVLAYSYWQSAFAGDPGIVGRELIVNGKTLTVVGVAPRGFGGTSIAEPAQVFLPITFRWRAVEGPYPNHTDRQHYWVYLFARLKPGTSLAQAEAAINQRYRTITNDVDAPLITGSSEQMLQQFRSKSLRLEPGARGQATTDLYARTPLTILLASTGLVLLIASVNVANLLLARGSARVGEIAVRASLGASRRRLFALLLAEVLMLTGAAVLVSVPLTLAAIRGVNALLPAFATRTFHLGLSGSLIAMTVGLAFVAAAVFGVIPALRLVRNHSSFSEQVQGSRSTGGKSAARFRTTLTTAQIALSMALLVLAGWFGQSLANVVRVDLGLTVESLRVFTIAPELNGYAPQQSSALFERIEQELADTPGVDAVAMAALPLLSDSYWNGGVRVEGYTAAPGEDVDVAINAVSADFFRTVGMPLIAGNSFEQGTSTDRPRVAIVNERFAEKFGLAPDAVGKRLAWGESDMLDMEIVGVVRDARYAEVREDPPPQLFMPREQATPAIGVMTFYVRSNLGSDALRTTVEQVLARHDQALPIIGFRTVAEQARENVFLDRFMSTLAAALAVIATVLAALGIYGVLSYGVVQRLREIGLRIALGAAPSSVQRMVLKQTAVMAGIGVACGVGLALLLGTAGRSLFFGLEPSDPLVPSAAVASLILVVFAAAYWPARRAAQIDPVTALRGD